MILRINNNISQLIGMTPETLKSLRKVLCYEPPAAQAYYSGSFRSNTRYLIDRQGFFPTGLLFKTQKHIEKLCLKVQIDDRRVIPKEKFSFNLSQIPYIVREEQTEAADSAAKHHRGIISAPTGSGKSVICALIIGKLRVRTLVVVPSLELKKQLTGSLKAIFGNSNVGDLHENFDVAIDNVDALDLSKPLKGYDCVIIDEFHHSAAKTYRELNKKCWNDVYFRFGLTATPFRSRDEEQILLESILSKVIYKIDYQTAVDKGYICPAEAYYYELPKQSPGTASSWPEVYSKLITHNAYRNKLIAGILDALESSGTSTLCLVREIQHGLNIDSLRSIPGVFVKGENDDNRIALLEFNLRQNLTMIGTVGVMGEGIDSKPCEYVIIAGLGKAKTQFMQSCGRAFRSYPGKTSCKIIIFKDASHKFTRSHFNEQCKILKEEYGLIPTQLPLP